MMGESPTASRKLERQAAGGGAAGNFSLVVQCGAMDGAGGREDHFMHGGQLMFRFDAQIGGAGAQVLDALLPKLCLGLVVC